MGRPSSLDLLNYLARTAGRERLLLVLTCRDDDLAHDANTRRGIRELSRAEMTRDLHLQPFTDDEIRELLATSDVRLPAEHHDRSSSCVTGTLHGPRAGSPRRDRRRPHRGAAPRAPRAGRRAAGRRAARPARGRGARGVHPP